MPTYEYTCKVCGAFRKASRAKGEAPPMYCGRGCMYADRRGQALKSLKYKITPDAHAAIERVYRRDSGNGQVAALAARLGLPRWKVTRYAQEQGWVAKTRVREPDWRPEELEVLERNAHHQPDTIQRVMAKYGFKRSVTGIVMKRKRLGLLQNLGGQSACSLAKCLGVDVHFVLAAINGGRLKAKRRGTDRTPQQGGDQYYIKDKDIRDYIVNHLHEIDIRKVDKHWFVDLLVNRLSEL